LVGGREQFKSRAFGQDEPFPIFLPRPTQLIGAGHFLKGKMRLKGFRDALIEQDAQGSAGNADRRVRAALIAAEVAQYVLMNGWRALRPPLCR
jgi:hypothetical protein